MKICPWLLGRFITTNTGKDQACHKRNLMAASENASFPALILTFWLQYIEQVDRHADKSFLLCANVNIHTMNGNDSH